MPTLISQSLIDHLPGLLSEAVKGLNKDIQTQHDNLYNKVCRKINIKFNISATRDPDKFTTLQNELSKIIPHAVNYKVGAKMTSVNGALNSHQASLKTYTDQVKSLESQVAELTQSLLSTDAADVTVEGEKSTEPTKESSPNANPYTTQGEHQDKSLFSTPQLKRMRSSN